MDDDYDARELMIGEDVLPASGIARWLPGVVVLTVLGGFVSLAWYAYHAGTQSVRDDDLPVIEADHTPVKEKPVDPGGMQFPNQDKTIFETFGGQVQAPPKVERVLPAPEEPMPKQADTSDTTTWINSDLHKHDDGAAKAPAGDKMEQVIGTDKKKDMPPPSAAPAPVDHPMNQGVAAQTASADNDTKTYIASSSAKPETKAAEAKAEAPKPEAKVPTAKPEPAKTEAAKADATKVVLPLPEAPKAPPAKKAEPAAPAGHVMVQLGAYRSMPEAKAAWEKMAHKNIVLLSGREPSIVKADLGKRGVYYRLRIGGFAGNAEASAFCSSLTKTGQACIIPVY